MPRLSKQARAEKERLLGLGLKHCKGKNGCDQILPLAEFYPNKASKDGLSANCKSCNRNASSKWRKNNPEKSKAQVARWRKENPDKVKAGNDKHNAKKKVERYLYKMTWSTGQYYKGESTDLTRLKCHESELRRNIHGNVHMQQLWNQGHTIVSFDMFPATMAEFEWIEHDRKNDPLCLNIRSGIYGL